MQIKDLPKIALLLQQQCAQWLLLEQQSLADQMTYFFRFGYPASPASSSCLHIPTDHRKSLVRQAFSGKQPKQTEHTYAELVVKKLGAYC
ncbi:hypothetical protein [Herbaspirillum rubrisubalbicans]|uniref:Uncharacterized protein n=1 Tax=Herbaspirillum rubrisubalbicans Os34 TaxID=1235827 RepID=A0A6M3ZMA7_9BURK|nr:hypothetical protein [Herbaspirillum rubrisubalbicans]QJP99462.1 hypothetical protein C798_04250 [Herbaspirillum rubrisubalbicans Os34]